MGKIIFVASVVVAVLSIDAASAASVHRHSSNAADHVRVKLATGGPRIVVDQVPTSEISLPYPGPHYHGGPKSAI